jgi:hypothetical protein
MQCWVDGVQVNPDSVHELGDDETILEESPEEDPANGDVLALAIATAAEQGDHDSINALLRLSKDQEGLHGLLDDLGGSAHEKITEEYVEEGWSAAQTKTGKLKAVGNGEHGGKTLYGKAAERALGIKRKESEEEVAQKKAAHEKTVAGLRKKIEARSAIDTALTDPAKLTHEQLHELADHLTTVKRDELREITRAIREKVGGLKAELADRLLVHVKQQREIHASLDMSKLDEETPKGPSKRGRDPDKEKDRDGMTGAERKEAVRGKSVGHPAIDSLLNARQSASPKVKDAIDAALHNVGIEDPEKPPKKIDADPEKISRRLVSVLNDLDTKPEISDQDKAPIIEALKLNGAEPIGTKGEVVDFAGSHHEGPAGSFTGHRHEIVKPGWVMKQPDGTERIIQKAETKPTEKPQSEKTTVDKSGSDSNSTPVAPSPTLGGAKQGDGKMEKPSNTPDTRTANKPTKKDQFGEAGKDHPVQGVDRKQRLDALAKAVHKGFGGDSDPMGLQKAGAPNGIDVSSFANDVSERIEERAVAGTGVGMRDLYDSVGEKYGLSKWDFLRAMTAANDLGRLQMSNWHQTPFEIPDPELAPVFGTRMLWWVKSSQKSPSPATTAAPVAPEKPSGDKTGEKKVDAVQEHPSVEIAKTCLNSRGGSGESVGQANPKIPDAGRPHLKKDEIAEVQDYLEEGTAYHEINEELRQGGRLQYGAKTLQAAIAKVPKFSSPVKASRGIEVPKADLPALLEQLRSGEFTHAGFVSASTQSPFPGNVQFDIIAHQGLDASFYGANAGEILLPAGTRFKVKSVEQKGNSVKAILEQVVEG